MAEKSAISWTRSTFNPWIGCTKVGPGCDHCYASVSTPARAQGIVWGPGQPRKRTTANNWNGPLKWNKRAAEEQASGIITPGWESWGKPGFWPVFCASLADVFDNEVPQEWRNDLWDLIDATPNLSWLLVTKRIGNVERMVPPAWMASGFPAHVRILITVVNQEEADRDIPKLLALPCKNGISYEPALGPIDFTDISDGHAFIGVPREFWEDCDSDDSPPALHYNALTGEKRQRFGAYSKFGHGLDWIIVGGESSQGGAKARPFDIQWARDTVKQCRDARVPVFVKQLGSNVAPLVVEGMAVKERLFLNDRAGADPSEWPDDLRVQEFPA